MVDSKQRRAKRARIYDQLERASDNGVGHPSGPTGWRKSRAPPATGNAAKLRRLRKGHPELHARVMAGELTVYKAATMAGFHRPKHKPVTITNDSTISRLQEMELWFVRSQILNQVRQRARGRRPGTEGWPMSARSHPSLPRFQLVGAVL